MCLERSQRYSALALRIKNSLHYKNILIPGIAMRQHRDGKGTQAFELQERFRVREKSLERSRLNEAPGSPSRRAKMRGAGDDNFFPRAKRAANSSAASAKPPRPPR